MVRLKLDSCILDREPVLESEVNYCLFSAQPYAWRYFSNLQTATWDKELVGSHREW